MKRFDPLLDQTFACALKYEFWPALDTRSKKLLIIMHGRGDTLEGFHFFPARLGIDSLNVLFLQAPDPYGMGFSWYDLPPHQGPGIIRSRNLIFSLLEKLQSEIGLNSLDIFLCGFSQGCLLCLDVGLRYPKLLGGVIGMSGYLFFEDKYPASFSPVAKKQRFWISHGHQDDVLSFENSRLGIQRLQQLDITIDWVPLNKEHTVDEVEEIPLIRAFINTHLEAN